MPAWASGAWATGAWAGTAWADAGVTVPDVVGETEAAGTATLEGAGFVVAVETAYSSVVAAGLIISQAPAGGAEVPAGSTVTIVVSLGEAPTPPASEEGGGGWAFYLRYEQERERRRRKRLEEEEAAEAAQALKSEVDREIAEILQRQEREDEKRREVERLRVMAMEMRESALFTDKVNDAIRRAQERQTLASLANLDRQLRQMIEEEEAAVMMLLIGD